MENSNDVTKGRVSERDGISEFCIVFQRYVYVLLVEQCERAKIRMSEGMRIVM